MIKLDCNVPKRDGKYISIESASKSGWHHQPDASAKGLQASQRVQQLQHT